MKTYYVLYTFVSGETNVSCKVLVKGDQGEKEAVHDHFKDRWGEKTECVEKGVQYNEYTDLEAIKVERVQLVAEEDEPILKKYMGMY
ncbi:hypothetical protein IMZ31_22440 (plasmid) [Pontibacillus sp. ALD_SL1]|uniref:hypothetical protein n=1 Tax=Pontibacillus sp. ALD_SL1 TaxID=2777185 RepID=UPI001A95D0C9|nr:hypothetical protein [Pontibacillus sp. ALD_SL1]QST02215.1 hypothetical protein IMZ31_22440 [Pontibacillus sp. ALD_SL1]